MTTLIDRIHKSIRNSFAGLWTNETSLNFNTGLVEDEHRTAELLTNSLLLHDALIEVFERATPTRETGLLWRLKLMASR